MTRIRLSVIVILLVCVSALATVIYQGEVQKRKIKEDLIELSKIKYGLFSVDEWKRILAGIITRKIEQFNFDGGNKQQMRAEISAFLYKAIADFEKRFTVEKSKSISGLFQMGVASAFGAFGQLKKQVPVFTDQIIGFMNDPRNRKAIRQYIISKMDEYADKTFSEVDYTMHDAILSKYNVSDRAAGIKMLTEQVETSQNQSKPFVAALLIMSFLGALLVASSNNLKPAEFMVITLICAILLITGLLLPMIEIDARIASMRFNLLGEPVNFEDQVLYYKSKSILEVVGMMFTQGRLDLILVGILVVLFSVLFPMLKLASSIGLIYSPKLKSNHFIKFMVFKTGKWSMADVMVIAIFMSYIGFSGIITEQLKQIETITLNIDILTTNKSSLQAGFFAFTSFAVLSLLVSHKLQYGFREEVTRHEAD